MFAEILGQIVNDTPGGVGVALMGYDGIAIEQHFHTQNESELQIMVVEYANVLKEIKRTVNLLDNGEMDEVSIKTDRYCVIVRILSEDYFVALTLEKDGNFGKGRYLLKLHAPSLIESLS